MPILGEEIGKSRGIGECQRCGEIREVYYFDGSIHRNSCLEHYRQLGHDFLKPADETQ